MTLQMLLMPILGALLSQAVMTQSWCYHQGSMLVAASWTPSPLPLGCTAAPTWPMWQMFTPTHRTPTMHLGYRPGRGAALGVIVVHYQCTGLLLYPVVPSHYRTKGYVIDMPEHPCN